MKKIINKKVYNTETAQEICGHYASCGCTDFAYFSETLYRTKKGAYFIYGEGGPASKYAVPEGNGWTGGSDIRILSAEEARSYAEKYASFEDYVEAFGAPEEA